MARVIPHRPHTVETRLAGLNFITDSIGLYSVNLTRLAPGVLHNMFRVSSIYGYKRHDFDILF